MRGALLAAVLLVTVVTAGCGSSFHCSSLRVPGWQSLGLDGEDVESIWIDPQRPQNLIAGSWGGVGQRAFASHDGGATWEPTSRRLHRTNEHRDLRSTGVVFILEGDPPSGPGAESNT